mgnify:CR=1 FL=1
MLMNLLSRYCIVLLFLLFHINIYGQEDSLSLLYGSHSYVEIIGLDLDVNQDDYLTISEDGSFEYHIGNMNRYGNWVLNKDTLVFTYPLSKNDMPIIVDDIAINRYFVIDTLSIKKIVLSEGESVFILVPKDDKVLSSVSMFSQKVDEAFVPIVDSFSKVIFYDITRLFGYQKGVPFIVIWLVFGALFFTFKMRFINVRGFSHSISLIRGDYEDPNHKGEVSHFQALTTALSGTVGLGNIAGVAIAISLGGPGATFWMIIAGLLGMSSKFVECTLGLKYRVIDDDGVVSGGPMYYLRDGLKKKNLAFLGRFLAVMFAVLCIGGSFGGGNMFQANQAFAAVKGIFPGLVNFGPLFGVCLACLVGVVIIGGIKSIAKVTEKVVPFMAAIYVGASLVIIMFHISDIGFVISEIFRGAFSPEAGLGGFVGVLIVGFKRAAFSNEAGVGSASIAHSAAKTKEPVSEGIVALLEPFIDTIVICTMTAFVIIITGQYQNVDGLGGSELTSQAFGSVITWFPYVLTIAILLFAFSTMISWSYYGLKSWTYLFGKTHYSEFLYKILFMIFIVIGSSANLGSVLDFSDMMILAMAFPNIIGLLLLSSEVKYDLNLYLQKLKNGTIKKYK